MKSATRVFFIVVILLLQQTTVVFAAPQAYIQVNMPTLICNKGLLEQNECILSGIIRVNGPAELNGPLKYFCNIRYSYVAASSSSQSIRFTGHAIYHSEVIVENGRAMYELTEKVELKLSENPRQVDVTEIGCEVAPSVKGSD